jgi:L-iditol 2-dehydrogenase
VGDDESIPGIVLDRLEVEIAEAVGLVRRGGKVLEIGHYCDAGEISVNPHVICRKDIDILGVWSYPQIQFETALEFLRRSKAPLEELVTHYIPLEKFEDGIKMLGSEGVYKVVVEPNK